MNKFSPLLHGEPMNHALLSPKNLKRIDHSKASMSVFNSSTIYDLKSEVKDKGDWFKSDVLIFFIFFITSQYNFFSVHVHAQTNVTCKSISKQASKSCQMQASKGKRAILFTGKKLLHGCFMAP